MELTDPNDYPHATRGRREQDDYKAAYDSAKESEAINANTDQLESLIGTTNSRLQTIDSHVDQVEVKMDTLAAKLDNVLGRLDNIIELMSTPEA